MKEVIITDANEENVDTEGFFCMKSKVKSAGFQQKMRWLKKRFSEGMKMKILSGAGRGLIEYIPGKYAWRAVDAEEYMVIHCIWVLGKAKGKGVGRLLLDQCIEDAKAVGLKGVAIVTNGDGWLAKEKFFLKNGFEEVQRDERGYQLMALRFEEETDWPRMVKSEERYFSEYKDGVTVLRTGQCPYIDASVEHLKEVAEERGIAFREVELKTAAQVRKLAPSAFGIFNAVMDGKLLGCCPYIRKDWAKRVDAMLAAS